MLRQYSRTLVLCWVLAILLASLMAASAAPEDALPNGARLPDPWPPRLAALPDVLPTPPYLAAPPAVIPIDVGRQLFVDDFLIEQTTLARRFHQPVYHPSNPILKPDREWEQADGLPMAMPYSGGVWFDPANQKFKMWYMGGYTRHLCYAESADGVAWTKPPVGAGHGTNIVLPSGATESNTVWLDLAEPDPNRRVKFFTHRGGAIGNMVYRASPDGIQHWSGELWKSGRCGDRTTVFHDPFRGRWVLNVRESFPPGNRGRSRRYWAVDNINNPAAVDWPAQDRVPLWVTADRGQDAPDVRIGVAAQLYHLDCIAYESLMLGFFSIWRGNHSGDSGQGRLVDPGRPNTTRCRSGSRGMGSIGTAPTTAPSCPCPTERGTGTGAMCNRWAAGCWSSGTTCTSTAPDGRARHAARGIRCDPTPMDPPGWPSSGGMGSRRWTPGRLAAP